MAHAGPSAQRSIPGPGLEAIALRDHVKRFGALGDWPTVAERFANYWLGDGSWAAMPDKRRAAFATSLPPNFHEWDAVMDEKTPVDDWSRLRANTLLVCARDTRRPIRELVDIFAQHCPAWSLMELPAGGHRAPLTRPESINPIVASFLASGVA